MEKALYWEANPAGTKCLLCPHECAIGPDKTGRCRVRKNSGGTLLTLNYAQVSSLALDPVEKKPLYHFFPGHTVLSAGTWGCNLQCRFCQNWEISQGNPPVRSIAPAALAEMASQQGEGCIGVAYTYSEPVVWYEYVRQTAAAVKTLGLKNVLVTNGFIRQEPLMDLLPWIDAMNIDVKAFNEDFYRTVCGGGLQAVKQTVATAAKHCHVEITTLVIPGMNDRPDEIEALASWLGQIDQEIPLHFSRYFPRYRLDAPPTPQDTLLGAKQLAERYLKHVYLGNV